MASDEQRNLQTLAERAAQACKQGDLRAARDLYEKLERAAPTDPQWPRQLASVHRRLNEHEAELDALIRCAGIHSTRGEFLPALATYKMILSIDPGHLQAQQLLDELQPHQTVSVTYQSDGGETPLRTPMQSADLEQPQTSKRRRRRSPPKRRQPSASAPLDELVLTQVVSGTRPASMAETPLDGVHQIPIESGEPPTPMATAVMTSRPVDPSHQAQLEQCPLFSSLEPDSLRELLQQVRLVELTAGEELFHQGDAGASLYIVATGAVVPIAEGQHRTRLAVLEPGEFFGEIALFTDQPRNATIEALVDSQLISIDRPVMWNLVRDHPDVLALLLRFLRDRLIGRLVRTSPLFQIFSGTKRSAIAQRFQFLEAEDGREIIQQHQSADAVFVLLSGRMEVVHCGDDGEEKGLATLESGDLCGEMSLLWREPSLASVIARGKCWLLALPAQSFREILDHHPQLAAMAAGIAEERRAANKRTLRDALGHRDGEVGII
jgi:CRP-like cAMP-binding protein